MSVTEIVESQENIIATMRAVKRGFPFISCSYNKVNVCFFTFGSLTIKKMCALLFGILPQFQASCIIIEVT